ncbi:thioredoxin [Sphaerisporangium siamense]|uniref:Fe-S cluster biogenesis protein NfuA n=1 Tax=Sphaerisporangium siamense TaxID=795645 RepID=A0A7W7G8D8_9ACTN|nr:NifU family protein [Sphaerisporangium siamense]MBB4701663.1 Fe-S cluster biogenesis protein NfuA [Sphaerisporangium siamense]GII84433.1 thioredoxin [Sphaerisporangium siamense]
MRSVRAEPRGAARREGGPGDAPALDVRRAGERAEALIDELAALADPAARDKAEELVRLLVGLYGAGLERMLGVVVECDAAEVLRRFTADEVVSGLLVLHDLHPLGTQERVRAALDGVRGRLGDGVELLGVDRGGGQGVVRLRIAGHGCASTRAAVTGAVEHAVLAAAPEVARVEVEQAAEAPPLLQIGRRPPGEAAP